MATTEDITLRIQLDQAKKALSSIPGLTEKSMKESLKAIENTSKAGGKAAQIAAKKAEQAAKEAAQATKEQAAATGKVMDKLTGGLAGDLEDLATSLGALGPYGLAAAAGVAVLTAGIVGTAAALVGISRAGLEAISSLDELGQSDAITPEQRQSIYEANAALDAIGVVASEFAVVLATEVAPMVTAAATVLAQMGLDALETFKAFTHGKDLLHEFAVFLTQQLVEAILMPITSLIDFGDTLNSVLGIAGLHIDGLDALSEAYHSGTRAVSDGIVDTLGFGAALEEAAGEADGAKAIVGDLTKRYQDNSKGAKEAAEAQKLLAEAYGKTLDGLRAIDAMTESAGSDQVSAVEKLTAAYQAQGVALDKTLAATIAAADAAGASADVTAAQNSAVTAREEIDARYYRDLEALRVTDTADNAKQLQQQTDDREAGYASNREVDEAYYTGLAEQAANNAQQMADADQNWAESHADDIGKILEGMQAVAAAYSFAADIATQVADLVSERSRANLEGLRAERDAIRENYAELSATDKKVADAKLKLIRKEADEQRKQIKIAFAVTQAAAVGQAIIAAGIAALTMIPAFAFLGPGAPFAAAGAAGAALGVQLAVISQQKPKFHGGYAPDEIDATITRGEGVANQRAMAQPGFRQSLRDANAGQPQGSQVIESRLMLNDRDLVAMDSRLTRIGRRATNAGPRPGQATHYDR